MIHDNDPAPRRLRPANRRGWKAGAGVTAAAALLTGSGVAAASASSPAASAASAASVTTTATPTAGPSGQPRSGPADGGATGTVESTSASSFTIATWTGVDLTVEETASTKLDGARQVRKGQSILVLGLVNAATSAVTITAARVDVQRRGDGGAAAGKRDGVVAVVPGQPGPAKSVGTIPAGYTQGTGTIVSGAQAYAAVRAAQAVFPGGVVDRVVELSGGDYEVHNIAIAWPHHVFVNSRDKVIGAND